MRAPARRPRPDRPTREAHPDEDPDLRLLLDADPASPIPPAAKGRRALGRDPFAGTTGEQPWLEALDRLGDEMARIERPVAGPPRRRRLEEIPDGELPEGWLAFLGEDARRRLAAAADWLSADGSPDPFGLSPEAVRGAFPFFYALYRVWFRVRSRGHENLPGAGPAILVANHGGLLPFDGAMTVIDVMLRTDPPRLVRCLVDRFVRGLPGVRSFYARTGQVVGTRANIRTLLGRGDLVMIFPEGVAGIRKTMPRRYQLERFHPGCVREALRARAPIVPVAITGPADQAPILYDVQPLARRLGLPVFPITPTFPWLGPAGLLPYPVRYRIHYGTPLRLYEQHGPEAAEDAELVSRLTADLRRRVQRLLNAARSAPGEPS
jgi:1-acyl-sn-glycerol-3-phosphate acyltransferase